MDSSTFVTIVAVLLTWFILIRWVLPWFGVPTCMGGGCCSVAPRTTVSQTDRSGNEPRDNAGQTIDVAGIELIVRSS